MTTLIASVLGGMVLFGAAWKAVPSIWGFIIAASKVPVTIQGMAHEFAPNSGESMRDKINVLTVDTAHLRESNHDLVNKMTALLGLHQLLAEKVDQHTIDDGVAFADTHEAQTQILEQISRIESAVEVNREVAVQVKHDLDQFNEIDTLGREQKIERRRE